MGRSSLTSSRRCGFSPPTGGAERRHLFNGSSEKPARVDFCEAASPVKRFYREQVFCLGCSPCAFGAGARWTSSFCSRSTRRCVGPRRTVGFGGWRAPSINRLSAEARNLFALRHRIAVPSRPDTLRMKTVHFVLGYAATAVRRRVGCPNSLPSRHIAYKIPASLRASATAAMRFPRRAAMRSAQSRRGRVASCS